MGEGAGRTAASRASSLSLGLIAPDLVSLLDRVSDARRRRVVSVVCDLAISNVGLLDVRAEQALAALASGHHGDAAKRRAVKELAEELDNAARMTQERVRVGTAVHEDFLRSLARVRAAAALAYAFDDDSLMAASEALYEAHHAILDFDMLRTVVVANVQ